ncbi:Cuticlin-6 [Frankliniella fusca]|uniref:Cuticlin-6 n=1 Tax=Frankliniella fusca TaxID=407009 RepID=A0AAE1HKW9_9NEOP|nr:Cuticlin-6 [Frankliniella fusca]
MAGWAATLLLAVAVSLPPRPAAAYMSERHSASNVILGISTACSVESLNVTVRMRHPFRGILYSRGFPLECSTAREQHHKLFDFLQQRERDRQGDRHGDQQGGRGGNQVPPGLQPAKEVTLSLPASECGIRVVPSKDGEGLWLQASVVVQLDRHLQQAADQTRTVSCHLPVRDSSILLQPPQSHRTARQRGEDIPSVDFAEASSSSSATPPAGLHQQQQHWQRARALMEILTTAGRGRDPGVLTVGEEAALIVTSHLPAGVGSRVTDCFAHDGAGEGMERLSDGRGCPTDRLILPQLREVRAAPGTASGTAPGNAQDQRKRRKRAPSGGSGLHTHVTAARFAAFKFPDRSRLHLRCQLQLCRGACPQVSSWGCSPPRFSSALAVLVRLVLKVIDLFVCFDAFQDSCEQTMNATRQERRARKGERGEVLGRLQVFNSVEVLAPGIEGDDRLRLDELTAASGGAGGAGASSSSERTFCMSPPKMALALAALGSVLLCAVAAALYSLLHRRDGGGVLGGLGHGDGLVGLGQAAPLRALLRRHFLRLRECSDSHGSTASLGERNVLVRVQDSPFGHRQASATAGSGGSPGLGPGPAPGPGHVPAWQDKLFH